MCSHAFRLGPRLGQTREAVEGPDKLFNRKPAAKPCEKLAHKTQSRPGMEVPPPSFHAEVAANGPPPWLLSGKRKETTTTTTSTVPVSVLRHPRVAASRYVPGRQPHRVAYGSSRAAGVANVNGEFFRLVLSFCRS